MYVYINDALRINFNIGIDTDETSAIVLNYRNPLGVEGVISSISVETAATGDVYTQIANDFLDTEGWWVFYSEATTTDGDFTGHQFQIEVRDPALSITNLTDVKDYLGYSDTTYDYKIGRLIPQIEEAYLSIRNAPFDTDPDGNLIYPPGADVTAAEMIEYRINQSISEMPQGVDSFRLGSYSVSYGSNGGAGGRMGGYPKSITSQIKTFVRCI